MLRAGITRLDAVVFTHQHKDHTAGLDDVRPFIFIQGKPMDVFAPKPVIEQLKREYAYAFEEKRYPGAPAFNIHEINDTDPFQVGDIMLTPIPAMHGKMLVLGFRAGDFAYLTDVNFIPHESMERLQELKVLVLDALRIEKHHSHFSLEEAVQVAETLKPEQTYFTHISHLMGCHADIDSELPLHIALGYDGLAIDVDRV